jgi:hypothetical protein
VRDAVIAACASDVLAEHLAELGRFDPVKTLENTGIENVRQARDVAAGLAGFGAILMMHVLLMPDTPGQIALRAHIDKLGMGPALMNLARLR